MKNTATAKKAGFVALVGRSNVGKSTLLNALVGSKVAITSPKPQTTRFPIHGIVHDARAQAVFVDTPGLFAKPREALTKRVHEALRETLRDIDLALYVVDPTREIGREEKMLISRVRALGVPVVLAINKMDAKEKPFLEDYRILAESFTAHVEISALRRTNVHELLNNIFELLPEGEAIYPEFQITNIETAKWVSELIREKIFLATRQELPYTVSVEVERIEEREDGMYVITAHILTTDEHHQRMLIGRHARMVKQIGSMARKELEAAMGKRIYLELDVRVDPHWVRRTL